MSSFKHKKPPENNFPESSKNFSVVQIFETEVKTKHDMTQAVSDIARLARKVLYRPNDDFKNMRANLLTACNAVKTYANYRKTVLTDQVYLLELVRKLTPEQRDIYLDMRKAMGVDVLGHAIEGDLSVGEIFGLERKVKGKGEKILDYED